MILTELQITSVIQFIINGILGAFNFLASIEFLGTNLLKFSIAIIIIGTALPIIFSLTNFRLGGTERANWSKQHEKNYNSWKEGGYK